MKKDKSIYEKPRRYAKKCDIPMEYARRLCKSFLKTEREMRKHNKCPVCGKRKLFYDYGDSEYSYDSWIECGNCGNTFEIGDPAYPRLTVGDFRENFDIFLWMSSTGDKYCEFNDYGDWIEFVKKEMLEYEQDK